MRMSEIIGLAQQYLVLGIILAASVGAVAAAGYFIVYRKLLNGKKRVRPLGVLWAGVTFCYLIVLLCATLLDRYSGGAWQPDRRILPLFYSYRDAWNSFSETAWRNIVLNILLFVPLGFLLPLGIRRFRKFWITYLTGLLCTVCIELLQLVLQRGIAEMDDIFNNFLGTMIGYGCFAFVRSLRNVVSGKKADPLRLTALQIPIIAAVLMFLGIAAVYNGQELGNLTSSWIVRQDVEGGKASSSVPRSEEEKTAPVYRLIELDQRGSQEFAERFFASLGQKLDDSRKDLYENTAFYWSREGNPLTIEYSGGTWDYTDFELSFPDEEGESPSSGAGEQEVRDALLEYGIELPGQAVFTEEGEGWYSFTADRCEDGKGMKDGILRCSYYKGKGFGEIAYRILECEEYKDFPIISEQEAYERILEGKYSGWTGDMESIVLGKASLTYQADSKGFYQPVWSFPIEGGEEGSGIIIPAVKK